MHVKVSWNCARRNLPHGNVVIDRFCVDYREVDVDAVTRGDSDHPHAILKVRIVGWVTRRINCAIHGGYIPTAESWNWGGLIENIKTCTWYTASHKRCFYGNMLLKTNDIRALVTASSLMKLSISLMHLSGHKKGLKVQRNTYRVS